MKKVVVLALLSGLVVASLGPAADAAKRKPRPVPKKFFLHASGTAGACDGPTFMDTKDGPDSQNGCGYLVIQSLNEVFVQTGLVDLGTSWPATGGLPFKLNAAKPLTGSISISPLAGAQAGNGILSVEVSAIVGGASVTLASIREEYTVAAVGTHTVTFSAALPKKLTGKKVTGLDIYTQMHGAVVGQHSVELDSPASFITVPTLK